MTSFFCTFPLPSFGTALIAKGYFDPKEYFQAIKIDNLDDQTFDNKIKAMFN